MKKISIILVFGLLLSCSQEGVYNDIPFDEMLVSVNTSLSKGAIIELPEDMQSVGVYAAHTVDMDWSNSTMFNKMNNQKFIYFSSSWKAEPTCVQWGNFSENDKYTFYAYCPFAEKNSEIINHKIKNGSLQINYDTPNNCQEQMDLMLATPRKDMIKPKSRTVVLVFNHVLSVISFSATGKNKTIISAQLTNIKSNGIVGFSDSDAIVWRKRSMPKNFNFALINNGFEDLLLIPQELSENTRLVVNYNDSIIHKDIVMEFDLATLTEFEINNRYSLIVTLSSEPTLKVINSIWSNCEVEDIVIDGLPPTKIYINTGMWGEGNNDNNQDIII